MLNLPGQQPKPLCEARDAYSANDSDLGIRGGVMYGIYLASGQSSCVQLLTRTPQMTLVPAAPPMPWRQAPGRPPVSLFRRL